MGRQRVAPSWPVLETSGGGGGDRPPASFGRAVGHRCCRRAEREVGIGQQWALVAGGFWPAAGAGGCQRALPGWGTGRRAGAGRWRCRGGWRGMEVLREVGRADGHMWRVFF
jgi:hypothetical protein